MHSPRRWENWETFGPAAREVIIDFYLVHKRPPVQKELTAIGAGWLRNAAQVYHGGYLAVLKRLHIKPNQKHRSKKRRGDWDTFSREARPVIQQLVQQLGHLPSQKELRQAGHHWIVTAAYYHYHGIVDLYERLGYPVQEFRRNWKWEDFARMAKPILEAEITRLGRTPYWHEMKSSACLRRILRPAQQKFGGYRKVLRQLGLAPTPLKCPQRGTGLADWPTFVAACRPFIAQFVAEHGRPPFRPEMKRLGHYRFVAAAVRHHNGYVRALQQMGFTVDPRQVQHPQRGWSSVTNQLQALRKHFPDYLALGVMPSSVMVIRREGGLYAHWVKDERRWSQIASDFGLMDSRPGKRVMLHVQSVKEALSFFEHHHRWPLMRECSPTLRHWRWKKTTTWEKLFSRTTLTKQALDVLVDRWRTHLKWCQQNQPELLRPRTRIMNRLIIARNDSMPTRLSV